MQSSDGVHRVDALARTQKESANTISITQVAANQKRCALNHLHRSWKDTLYYRHLRVGEPVALGKYANSSPIAHYESAAQAANARDPLVRKFAAPFLATVNEALRLIEQYVEE